MMERKFASKMKRKYRLTRTAMLAMIAGTAMVATSACAAESNGNGNGDETTTIRVVTSVPNSVPYIVLQAAAKIGVWDGTGLDVEVISGSTPTIGQVMAGGQADMALANGPTLVGTIEQGLNATIVAGNDLIWDTRMIVGSASTAKSAEDLKGANFGITGRGGPGDYSVVRMAEKLGWSEADYKFTTLKDLPSLMAALESGAIDAFPWGSDVGYRMQALGTGKIVADAADFVGPNVFHGFSVNDDFIEKHPDLLKRFFEAYFEAVKRVQQDPKLLLDILVNDWNVAADAAQLIVDEGSFDLISTDGAITDDELKGLADAAAYSLGDDSMKDKPVKFTYWKDL